MRLFAHKPLLHAARLHYQQPHRGYHNQDHLDELIALARDLTPDLSDAEQLAVLFHDAVYVPGAARGENERLSARLLDATMAALAREDEVAVSVDTPALTQAGAIIEATTHHAPPPDEAARVCDLDLWRLAAPWPDFERHALGIRHEYLHLAGSDGAYWVARNAFYQEMLAKPLIFATRQFQARFEDQARANLRQALNR